MILLHRFIWENRKQDFELGGSYFLNDFKWFKWFFMILSESIIQDGRDGVLHRFTWANQKYDSETSKSYSYKFQNESSTSSES